MSCMLVPCVTNETPVDLNKAFRIYSCLDVCVDLDFVFKCRIF